MVSVELSSFARSKLFSTVATFPVEWLSFPISILAELSWLEFSRFVISGPEFSRFARFSRFKLPSLSRLKFTRLSGFEVSSFFRFEAGFLGVFSFFALAFLLLEFFIFSVENLIFTEFTFQCTIEQRCLDGRFQSYLIEALFAVREHPCCISDESMFQTFTYHLVQSQQVIGRDTFSIRRVGDDH